MTTQGYLEMDYYTRAAALSKAAGVSGDAELLTEPTIIGKSQHADRHPYQRNDREEQILNAALGQNGQEPGRSAEGNILMESSVASFARTVNPAPAEWLRSALQGTSAPSLKKPGIGISNFPIVNQSPPQDGVVPMSGDNVDEAGVVRKFGAAMTPYVTPEPLGEYGDNGQVRKRDYYEVRIPYELAEGVSGVVVHHFSSDILCLQTALETFGTGNPVTFGSDPEINTFLRMVTSAALNAPDFYTTFYHRAVYKRINPNTVYGDSFLGSHWLNCLGCPIPELVSFSLVTTSRGLVSPYAVSRIRDKAIVAKHLFSQILIVSSSPSTRRAAGKVQMVPAADGGQPVPQLMYMDVGSLMYTRPATMPFCFTFDGISGLLVGLNAIYAGFTAQPRTQAEIAEAEREVQARKAATRKKQSLALSPLFMDKATQKAIADGEILLSAERELRKRRPVVISVIQYGPDHRPMLDDKGQIAKASTSVDLMDIASTFQENPTIAPYIFGDSPANLSGESVLTPKPARPVPDDENADVFDELFASYTRKMAKYNALVAGISLEKLEKLADAGEWERLAQLYRRALASYHIDHAPKVASKTSSLGSSLGGKRIKQFKTSRNIADIFGSFTEPEEMIEPPPVPAARKRPPPTQANQKQKRNTGPTTRNTGKKSRANAP